MSWLSKWTGVHINPGKGYYGLDFNEMRDSLERAAVLAGNYLLPGSSILTTQLASKGVQDFFNSPIGMIANVGSGGYGAAAGNLANYGKIANAAGSALGIGGGTAGTAAGTTAGTAAATGGPMSVADSLLAGVPGAGGAAGAAGSAAGAAGGAGGVLSGMAKYAPYVNMATSLLGANMQAGAAKDAAAAQMAAAQQATGLQRDIFNTINLQQTPYRAAGYGALNTIGSMLPGTQLTFDAYGNPIGTQAGSGYFTKQFGPEDLTANLAPNYEFMKQQGLGAVTSKYGPTGGGSNRDITRTMFAEKYAQNAYQDAFNNFQTQRGNIYNTLAGVAGIGQTGQSQTNIAGTNFANAAGQLGIGAAGAYGAGQVGAANAYGSALNNIGNQFLLQQLLKKG
jgi:hypothetical protein